MWAYQRQALDDRAAELRNRGVADVCIACCDGIKGLPEAIEKIWQQATVQQYAFLAEICKMSSPPTRSRA